LEFRRVLFRSEHDLGQAPLGARLRTDGELHLGYVRDLAHPPDRPVRVLYLVTRPLAQNVEYLACASPERRVGQNATAVNAQVMGGEVSQRLCIRRPDGDDSACGADSAEVHRLHAIAKSGGREARDVRGREEDRRLPIPQPVVAVMQKRPRHRPALGASLRRIIAIVLLSCRDIPRRYCAGSHTCASASIVDWGSKAWMYTVGACPPMTGAGSRTGAEPTIPPAA